jgi:hypothetical protein
MRSILALSLAFTIVGCGGGESGEKGSFVGEGYSINPPAGWEHNPVSMMGATGDSFLSALEPGATFRPNLVIMKEPMSTDISSKAYAEQAIPMVRGALTDYKLLEQTDVKIGDHDAVRLVIEHRLGEQRLRLTQYLLSAKGGAWSMGCTTTQEETKAVAPCEEAVKSFRLE